MDGTLGFKTHFPFPSGHIPHPVSLHSTMEVGRDSGLTTHFLGHRDWSRGGSVAQTEPLDPSPGRHDLKLGEKSLAYGTQSWNDVKVGLLVAAWHMEKAWWPKGRIMAKQR